MKRIKNILNRLGLSENEIEVYLEIIKHKSLSHYSIAKKTGIPRTTVYDIVLNLENKKLIEVTQNTGQSDIKAYSPNVLQEIVSEKLSSFQTLQNDISEIVPKLQGRYAWDNGNSSFQFFEGMEGARKAYFMQDYETAVDERLCITDLSSMNIFGVEDRENTYPYVVKELIPINEWSRYTLKKWLRDDPDFVTRKSYRFIEHPLFKTYTKTSVLGNRVFYSSATKNESWGAMIASTAHADTTRSFFEFAWSKSRSLTADVIRKWPEIAMPTGTFDAPSVKIEGGKLAKT